MKALSARVTAFLMQQAIISAEDKDVYEYGFELIFSDIINLLVILTVGSFAGQLWFSVLYTIVFVGLRSFCGGYHAKTHLRCHIGTIGAFLVFLILNANFHPSHTNAAIFLCGNLIASIPVLLFAPVTNANKPLTIQLYRRNRRLALTLYFLLTMVSALLLWNSRQEGIAISLTLWIVSLCIIPAINYEYMERRRELCKK